MANRERDDNIYYARLAEQGERYEDMIRYMKEVAAVSIPLSHSVSLKLSQPFQLLFDDKCEMIGWLTLAETFILDYSLSIWNGNNIQCFCEHFAYFILLLQMG